LPYLIAYGVPTLLFAIAGGALAVVATLGTLALGWPLMYLSGAVALERSTRYPSPWKSTADSLIVTTLLVGGLVYGTVGLILSSVVGLLMQAGAGSGALSTAIYVGVAVLSSIAAMILGWLLLRIARDYIRGAALAIKEGKGDLPEKRYTLKFPVPPKKKDRDQGEDDEIDDELPPIKSRKQREKDDGIDDELPPMVLKRRQPKDQDDKIQVEPHQDTKPKQQDEDDKIRDELPPDKKNQPQDDPDTRVE